MTTTALIVGDLQAGIVDNYPFAAGVLPVVEKVLPAARASGIPVIFIRFGLRASGLDVAAGNRLISGLHGAGTLFHEESAETLVHPRIAPLPGEAVVLKRRASAFAATDLDRLLPAQHIDSIVLTGVATGAMIAATLYGSRPCRPRFGRPPPARGRTGSSAIRTTPPARYASTCAGVVSRRWHASVAGQTGPVGVNAQGLALPVAQAHAAMVPLFQVLVLLRMAEAECELGRRGPPGRSGAPRWPPHRGRHRRAHGQRGQRRGGRGRQAHLEAERLHVRGHIAMLVHEVMSSPAITVRRTDSVWRAIRTLHEHDSPPPRRRRWPACQRTGPAARGFRAGPARHRPPHARGARTAAPQAYGDHDPLGPQPPPMPPPPSASWWANGSRACPWFAANRPSAWSADGPGRRPS
ncbi:isochorismatase family protein [Nonomuraea sp. NPDC049709]|uniref:isochorismatase family protein n=1 Tax=Nonomuraea sp. NPDC049709 TaxID=3154736 RepID=UPI0034177597